MMVHRIIALCIGCIAGIVAVSQWGLRAPLAAALVPAALAGAWLIWQVRGERRWRSASVAGVWAAAMVVGISLGVTRTAQVTAPPTADTFAGYLDQTRADTMIRVRGNVVGEPDISFGYRGDFDLRVDEVFDPSTEQWRPVAPGDLRISWYRPYENEAAAFQTFEQLLTPDAHGFRVEAAALYTPTQAAKNPGAFDYDAFLTAEAVLGHVRIGTRRLAPDNRGSVTILEPATGHVLMEWALWLKTDFLRTYRQVIPDPASRLVSATTLGTRNALKGFEYDDKDITQTFRHAGVGHVLAVSGLHVSIIALLFYILLRAVRLPPKYAAVVVIFLLILFTLLTGARPSTVRAAIMNSVILIAFAYFRMNLRHATYVGLALSAMAILLHKPLVLYTPAFQLSFGAVLSLVLISPPLDRWVVRMRGATLLLFFAWVVGVYVFACIAWPTFIQAGTLIALVGLLAVMLQVGGKLNHHLPWLWRVGLDRVPVSLRLFVAAQMAIQLGMMIPMSAWFFGQFPMAGMIVNLLAIPLVGVIVQLGMLVGIVGLVPVIGEPIARCFGATVHYIAELFYWSAAESVDVFPFQPLPQPSVGWMIGYFVGLYALVWFGDRGYLHAQNALYQWVGRTKRGTTAIIGRVTAAGGVIVLAVGLALPLLGGGVTRPTVTVYHADGYPAVSVTGEGGNAAAIINAGDAYTGDRAIFEGLRQRGAVQVDVAIVAGTSAAVGHAGVASVLNKMRIDRVYVPFVASDANDYLRQLGDDYVADAAAEGAGWAQAYNQAYMALADAASQRRVELAPLDAGPVVRWGRAVRIESLNDAPVRVERFVTAANGRLIRMNVAGYDWLIVTETTPDQFNETMGRNDVRCDVLVLPDRTASNRFFYRELMTNIMRAAQPRVIVISDVEDNRYPSDIAEAATDVFGSADRIAFRTNRDGAVVANVNEDGVLVLTGYFSGKTVTIENRQSEPQRQ